MNEVGYDKYQALCLKWNDATAKLAWGVQRAFHSVFELASEGKTHLVYGADYRNNNPCLVNSVGTMLTVGGGNGIPSAHFGEVVRTFDELNRILETKGVNTQPGLVSPLAADVFLQHFAPFKADPNLKVAEAAEYESHVEYIATEFENPGWVDDNGKQVNNVIELENFFNKIDA